MISLGSGAFALLLSLFKRYSNVGVSLLLYNFKKERYDRKRFNNANRTDISLEGGAAGLSRADDRQYHSPN